MDSTVCEMAKLDLLQTVSGEADPYCIPLCMSVHIPLVVLQSLHEAGIVFVSETQGQSPMLYGGLSRPGARELGRPAERRPIN